MSINLEGANGGFMSFGSGAIAGGTTASTFKTTATIPYTRNGVFLSKAATDNLPFSSGHTALGNSQACMFALWLDSAGAVTTTQGAIVTSMDNCPPPAQVTPNVTLFGLIKVVTSSAQTFTANTSTLGTGNTATYYNVALMPSYSL